MRTLRNPWVVVSLVLVPLVVAAAFLSGTWGQGSRLDKVQAAIVNLDQFVTIDGQPVPLGRQLAVALSERDDENVTWNLADAAGAAEGIESGEYAAVVTIPQNFSRAATSYAGEAGQAEQATIEVRTSPSAPVADASLARQIAQLATDELNATLTQTYLDNVYIGFNQSGEQFTTLATAATQLSSGAQALADGAAQASSGTRQLDQGLRQLGVGAEQLSAGTPALVTGAGQLTEGGRQVRTGGAALASSGAELSQGAQQLATGSDQLATGVEQFAGGVEEYTTGTAQVVAGLGQLDAGIQELNLGLQQAAGGTNELQTSLDQLRGGSQGVAAGAEQLSSGLTQYRGALTTLAEGPAPTLDPVPGAAEVEQGCLAQGNPAKICVQSRTLYEQAFAAGATFGWRAGLAAAGQGLTGNGDPTRSLVNGASQLATGAGALDAGVAALQTELPAELAAQQQELATGVQALATGSSTLASRSQALVGGGEDLASGADQLAAGARQSARGTQQLADGVTQYTSGVGQYANGVRQYSEGVDEFASGAAQYATGAGQLADGVVAVADNSPALAAGISQLATGSQELADGTSQFAEGISEGAEKVPSYSSSERQQLSTVVANPVQRPEGGVVRTALVPLTLLVLALATWLGAMALHLVTRPVPHDVLASSAPTWRLVAATLLPSSGLALVWAAVLSVLGALAMGTSFGTWAGLFAVLALAAVAFVVVNHALAAWLPGPGRLLSVVWAAAAVAVGTTSALPGVFGVVHGFGPIKPALDGLRAVVAGTSPVGAVVAMLVWTLVALVFSAVAFVRARQLSVAQYRRLATAA